MEHNKIVVITPSIRPEGIPIVQKALEAQTFVDFDWIICSPFDPHNWATWIKDDFKGGLWTLNRSYSAMAKQADCDLLVSWQDFTSAGEDTLERFWKHYEYDDKLVVGAIGDKYEKDDWKVKTWTDPRKPGVCGFANVEWNLSSCPKQSLKDIGYFDDEMDFLFLGCDGLQVNNRLSETGHTFYVDDKIRSYSLGHGRIADWDKLNGVDNGNFTPYRKRIADLKNQKRWPVIGKL